MRCLFVFCFMISALSVLALLPKLAFCQPVDTLTPLVSVGDSSAHLYANGKQQWPYGVVTVSGAQTITALQYHLIGGNPSDSVGYAVLNHCEASQPICVLQGHNNDFSLGDYQKGTLTDFDSGSASTVYVAINPSAQDADAVFFRACAGSHHQYTCQAMTGTALEDQRILIRVPPIVIKGRVSIGNMQQVVGSGSSPSSFSLNVKGVCSYLEGNNTCQGYDVKVIPFQKGATQFYAMTSGGFKQLHHATDQPLGTVTFNDYALKNGNYVAMPWYHYGVQTNSGSGLRFTVSPADIASAIALSSGSKLNNSSQYPYYPNWFHAPSSTTHTYYFYAKQSNTSTSGQTVKLGLLNTNNPAYNKFYPKLTNIMGRLSDIVSDPYNPNYPNPSIFQKYMDALNWWHMPVIGIFKPIVIHMDSRDIYGNRVSINLLFKQFISSAGVSITRPQANNFQDNLQEFGGGIKFNRYVYPLCPYNT